MVFSAAFRSVTSSITTRACLSESASEERISMTWASRFFVPDGVSMSKFMSWQDFPDEKTSDTASPRGWRERSSPIGLPTTSSLLNIPEKEGFAEITRISANPSFSGMFNNEDVVGKPIGELLSLHPLGEAVSEVFSSGKSCHDMNFDMETPSGTKNLEAQVIEIRSSEADSERQALVVIDDVTERKAAEKTIYRMAYYDNLTGLANRRLLIDRLNHALGNARRQGLYAGVAEG